MGNYGRFPLRLVRGRGSEVYDESGRRYIDLLAGLSVCALGHCPEIPARRVREQLDRLWHVSNLYHIPIQEELASRLVELSFADQVFFCNSGTEAMEACLKLARLAAARIHGKERPCFVAMENSFHGRTFGSLSVTGQTHYQEPFRPLLSEVRFCRFGDLASLASRLDDSVAAVILEPLQAEGGLHAPPQGYLKGVRELCLKHGALLVYDEVQVGMGRLGQLFAYEHYGVEPDILALAKGLGGGFPIGAMLARHEVSRHLVPGTHASTFGGNPLAMSAALGVLEELTRPGFMEAVCNKADTLSGRFDRLLRQNSAIRERRGAGLLQGLLFDRPVALLIARLHERGVLTGSAGKEVLRLAPALNIPDALLAEGLDILEDTLKEPWSA